ncbi:hypothetical protein BDD12DRAFT_862068 [Trichophaea hybrida]|nr:hypothetical protein BDD12DRAFT_862068 [Trichophaea hybrida]
MITCLALPLPGIAVTGYSEGADVMLTTRPRCIWFPSISQSHVPVPAYIRCRKIVSLKVMNGMIVGGSYYRC